MKNILFPLAIMAVWLVAPEQSGTLHAQSVVVEYGAPAEPYRSFSAYTQLSSNLVMQGNVAGGGIQYGAGILFASEETENHLGLASNIELGRFSYYKPKENDKDYGTYLRGGIGVHGGSSVNDEEFFFLLQAGYYWDINRLGASANLKAKVFSIGKVSGGVVLEAGLLGTMPYGSMGATCIYLLK